MKKIATIILSLLVCTVLFTGCGNSSKSSQVQSLKVYSFSGNSESISVSNGVIVLAGKDEICYGGNLKVMSDDFADITAYSTTIYVDGEEDSILLSHTVADQTGGTIDVSDNIGKISGDVLRDGDADKLALHDSLVVPLTEVLADKRDDRLIERVHRDIHKTLEVRGGGVSGHDVRSELVDGRLNDDVREGEQCSLKPGGKTDSDDLTEL